MLPIASFNKIKIKPNLLKTKAVLKAHGGHSINIVSKCNMILSQPNENETSLPTQNTTKTLLGLKTYQDLSAINVHHITTKPKTDSLTIEYADVFKGLGKVEEEYHINLHQNANPVIYLPRKVPHTILPKLKETLNKLVKANVISNIEEPRDWVNSLVIVVSYFRKKDKTLRLCLEPRRVNQYIFRDYRTIPKNEQKSSKLPFLQLEIWLIVISILN